MLFVSHILTDVTTLGPGSRIAVWFTGCGKKCEGCCAPELSRKSSGIAYDPEELASLCSCIGIMSGAEGITLSGGDPLEQNIEEMELFLSLLNFDDVFLFTGYDSVELEALHIYERISGHVSAVKCGRYVRELDSGHPLMGSDNQCICYPKPSFKPLYEEYIRTHKRSPSLHTDGKKIYYSGLPDDQTNWRI